MLHIRHDSSVWQALEGVAVGVACQYGGKIQPCGFCGLGVYQMVAGVEGIFLGHTEIFQGFEQSFRVWLVGGHLLAAYDMVYQMLAMGLLELFLDAAGGLAGYDADSGAAFLELLQGWQSFRIEVGAGGHIAVGYLGVDMAEAVDEFSVSWVFRAMPTASAMGRPIRRARFLSFFLGKPIAFMVLWKHLTMTAVVFTKVRSKSKR